MSRIILISPHASEETKLRTKQICVETNMKMAFEVIMNEERIVLTNPDDWFLIPEESAIIIK